MKDLDSLIAANADSPPFTKDTSAEQALRALKIARSSLRDALAFGKHLPSNQRKNIYSVDLPAIEAAIERLEREGVTL